jgi:hypothetical protein
MVKAITQFLSLTHRRRSQTTNVAIRQHLLLCSGSPAETIARCFAGMSSWHSRHACLCYLPKKIEQMSAKLQKRLGRQSPERRIIRACFLPQEWRIVIREKDFKERCDQVGNILDAEHLITLGDRIIRSWQEAHPEEAKKLQKLRQKSRDAALRWKTPPRRGRDGM